MKKFLKKDAVCDVIDKCAHAAWDRDANRTKVFKAKNGFVLTFTGHIFEPDYECFETTCRVTLDDGKRKTVLYDQIDRNVAPYKNIAITTGSIKKIEEIVENNKFLEEKS